jgi:hypothetical protein
MKEKEMVKATKQALVQLDILSVLKGHDKERLYIEDDDPKKRKQIAAKITALIKDGFQVLLADGTKVVGYDADTNEWLVPSGGRKNSKKKIWDRVSALGQPANAIAPVTGG